MLKRIRRRIWAWLPLMWSLAFAAVGSKNVKTQGQTTLTAQNQSTSAVNAPAACGPPSYECSYDGVDIKQLCTNCNIPPVPDMSTEPDAVTYDKVLGITTKGNQIVRCTYPSTNDNNNRSYSIGFGGSGDTNAIGKAGGSPLSYRLIVSDQAGFSFPFTYIPDPVHPTCHPTYSGADLFGVTDGSFSWLTPHLYYAFGGAHFRINAIDLGSTKPPKRVPIVDFQQVLPRNGPDWAGQNQLVPLGTIIKPQTNNSGKFLYQATCPPRQSSCSPGWSGSATPEFNQQVMTDTQDGGVIWRNIGAGFNDAATWTSIGGVSKDDDVFIKSFSDSGGQGGPGGIFAAAYKKSTNTYYVYNTGTGIISRFSCSGGKGFSCDGGSWVPAVLGMTSLPDRYLIHDAKVTKRGRFVVLVDDSCRFDTCSIIPGGPGLYLWDLESVNASVSKVTTNPWGHWTEGFDLMVNQNEDPTTNLNARRYTDPDHDFALNYFPTRLADSIGRSSHPSWNYNDGTDTTPVCTATEGFDWPYVQPWQNEVICYGTNPNPECGTAGHYPCRNQVKRFFHTYNPGTCNADINFSSCWGIGAASSDGRYYAFTSNWGDTLGSTTRGGHGPNSCTGGFNFQSNHSYQVGDIFEPMNYGNHPNKRFNVYQVTVAGRSSNYPPTAWPKAWLPKQNDAQGYYSNGEIILPLMSPNNPCNHAFQVVAGGGGPNGSKAPIWKNAYGYNGTCKSANTGAKVIDGGVTWLDIGEYTLGTMRLANLGRDDCRSDVFIGALN